MHVIVYYVTLYIIYHTLVVVV